MGTLKLTEDETYFLYMLMKSNLGADFWDDNSKQVIKNVHRKLAKIRGE